MGGSPSGFSRPPMLVGAAVRPLVVSTLLVAQRAPPSALTTMCACASNCASTSLTSPWSHKDGTSDATNDSLPVTATACTNAQHGAYRFVRPVLTLQWRRILTLRALQWRRILTLLTLLQRYLMRNVIVLLQ